MIYAHIVGWGKHVPPKVMTNHDLAKIVDTSDEWIVPRTGIRERRIAGPKESSFTMGYAAAREALEKADMLPTEVGLIICATATPEHTFPSTASLIQDALGATHAGAFDLSAGCAGFVYALSLGAQVIQGGGHKVVLVIGSETMSRITNWKDRGTCILFGDGAGAVVLQASEQRGGVLSSLVRSDGSGGDLLIVPAGGSKLPASAETVLRNQHTIEMDGREIFRFATRIVDKSTREVLEQAGLTLDDVELFIPHQANLRIIQAGARTLGVDESRVFVNLEKYGNTSSASIPLALCEAVECGRVRPGDHLVLIGFGAGLAWAAAAIQWGPPPEPRKRTLPRQALRVVIYPFALVRSRVLRMWYRFESRLFGSPVPKNIDQDGKKK
ncbi:3-oxoacyl-[acyl-carrier-protein] synthase III [Thermoflexales bacterium]|nr:3-oxoacyl-[acyl-carrier-protein] synthase III [Thermoflexales bacterium]